MATATLNELKGLVEIVPYYDGNVKILNNFIKVVDDLYLELDSINLTRLQRKYLLTLIKNKLIHTATEILSENHFENWEVLKLFITTNFTDKANIVNGNDGM